MKLLVTHPLHGLVFVAALGLLLAACNGSGDSRGTVITFFDASTTAVGRNTPVTLTWQVDDPGAVSGSASCSLTRRAEGLDAETPFDVPCTGSLSEMPPAPYTSTYIRYQLSALKRPLDPADPYVTRVLTIDLGPSIESGEVLWTRQFGTMAADRADAVAVDADGNLYVAGTTGGSLGGAFVGTSDAFLRSYALNGDVRWTRQFGTEAYDTAVAVAVDDTGRVYVAGSTDGSLDGTSAGSSDAFVRAFASDGTHLWTQQFGTTGYDTASGVAVDQLGRVYVVGSTDGALGGAPAGGGDAFVRSFTMEGSHRWTRQFGSTEFDYATGVAVDDTGVFVVGSTGGNLASANTGYSDVFLRSFDFDGEDGWSRQFGSGEPDYGYGVSVGGDGGVVVAGYTFGGSFDGPPSGLTDAVVRTYSSEGGVTWTRQFGSAGYTESSGVASDDRGNVFLTGSVSANNYDALLVAYEANGGYRWSRSFGTEAFDRGMGVATLTDRAVIVVGITGGVLVAPSAGGADAFVRVYAP